jgi:hypothetical protein
MKHSTPKICFDNIIKFRRNQIRRFFVTSDPVYAGPGLKRKDNQWRWNSFATMTIKPKKIASISSVVFPQQHSCSVEEN